MELFYIVFMDVILVLLNLHHIMDKYKISKNKQLYIADLYDLSVTCIALTAITIVLFA